jgi:hypothetical protein
LLDARLGLCFWCLRVACGVLPIVYGLEKFNTGGPWLRAAGVVELIAGILIFTALTEVAAYFLTAWFLLLALQTANGPLTYELAVSDVLLAVGAFVLAQLTRVNESATRRVGVVEGSAASLVRHEDLRASARPNA